MMPAPVGILAGVPETPGDIAERGMVRTQQMDLAEQANARAQGTAGMEQEKFQLEKQFVPFRLKQAQQETAANDLKFSQMIEASKNKQEGMRLGNEMAEKMKAGTLTEQDMLAYGINISRNMGDMSGMMGAINAYSHVVKETEQGKAHGKLFVDLGVGTVGGGLFGKAFAPDAKIEDLSGVLKVLTENPAAMTLETGKKLMAQTFERMGKMAPPAYVDAVKIFYARLASTPAANAAQLWTQILSENPDAAPYGKDHEPLEAKSGMEVQKKGAEAKAVEEAKLPSAKALEAQKAASAIGLERVKGEETRKLEADRAKGALERVQTRVNRPTNARDAAAVLRADIALRNSLVSELKDPALALSVLPEVAEQRKGIQDRIGAVDLLLETSRQDLKSLMKRPDDTAGAEEVPTEGAVTGIDVARMKTMRERAKNAQAKGWTKQAWTSWVGEQLKKGNISADEEKRILAEPFTEKKVK